MAAPLVSVLMPAYRSAGFVGRALESALAQTMTDLEVVFVDDASEDGTADVAAEFARLDSRVRVFANERNLGTSATVNRAIKEARGVWVAQHDHDDTWRPERLERLLAAADDADAVSDDIEIVGDRGPERRGFEPGSMLEQLGLRLTGPRRFGLVDFIRFDPGLVHPLVRRAFLVDRDLGLDPSFSIGADFGLWVRLLAHGARWVQLPEAYYVWNPAPTAQTRRLEAMADEAQRMTRVLASEPLVAGHPGAVEALERRAKLFRSHVAHAQVRSLLATRSYARLAVVLAGHPGIAPLLLWRKALYARLARRRTVDADDA